MFQKLPKVMPGQQSTAIEAVKPNAIGREMLAELGLLFKCLAIRGSTPEDMEINFRLYAEALSDLPFSDVQSVCAAYRRAELGDGTWCPKPPELRKAVVARLDAAAARKRQADRVAETFAERERLANLRASRTKEERERVAALVENWKAGLPPDGMTPPTRQPTQAEAQAWLEAHEGGAGLEPVTASERLAEFLKRPRQ